MGTTSHGRAVVNRIIFELAVFVVFDDGILVAQRSVNATQCPLFKLHKSHGSAFTVASGLGLMIGAR